MQTALTLDAKTLATKALVRDSNLISAKAQAVPIVLQLSLYNEENNYTQYLLSVMLPCMWLILIAIGMLNFIQKASNMRELLISILANVCVFSFWGMGMAFYFNFIGMEGHYAHLLLVFLAVVLMAPL